ncbi:MAG: amino acid permease, partial [Planctomycetia bacterium]|nr:amino acid permease [Planctomycetia bacterium]
MPEPEPEPSSGAARAPAAMPAEFGVATATFVIVASMVGTGVLTTSGFTVLSVGSNQLMLILWVVGGVTAACGALALCELTAALPRSGGDYVYLHEAYGPLVAFLSGWVSFLIGFAAPAAAAGIGAALYLTAPFGLEGGRAVTTQRVLATALIVAFAWVHTTGRKQTARVQGWITAVKLVILIAFVVAGLIAGRSHFGNLADPLPITYGRFVDMMFSLVYITYAYIGWNAASYLAGEFVDPQRQLPRAIVLGTAGVVVLYVGLNVVFALALSAAEVREIVQSPANTMPPGRKELAVAPIANLAAARLFSPRLSTPFT